MTEHADARDFTPERALSALSEATGFEEPLRQRTEGLTWMVYGLATAGIFTTYGFYGAVAASFAWWAMLLWVPWIAAASLATAALWRSAALSAPNLVTEEPSWRGVTLAWLAFFFVAWGTALFVMDEVHGGALFLLFVGTAWFGIAAVNLYRCGRLGRRVGITIGGVTALNGLALVGASFVGAGSNDIGIAAVVLSGLVPIAGGYWQTTRG